MSHCLKVAVLFYIPTNSERKPCSSVCISVGDLDFGHSYCCFNSQL